MRQAGWVMFAISAGVAVSTLAWADGLTGLDAKLRGTGRIGTPPPQSAGRISARVPDAGAPERTRDPRRAAANLEEDDDTAADAAARAARPAQSEGANEDELQRTDGAVADCRVEVARRRKLPPAKIAAGTVTRRFTIERSGRVREAEALSAVDTDLEIAACAKRVLADWKFPKRVRDAEVIVQRTYRFSRG